MRQGEGEAERAAPVQQPLPGTAPVPPPAPRTPLAANDVTQALWNAVLASRVLHQRQVNALRSIAVRRWDSQRVVLAPGTPADHRLALEHKRDVERMLAQIGQHGCVVEIVPPADELDEPPVLGPAPETTEEERR